MTTTEAINSILTSGRTKYSVAKELGCHPVSINQWLRGTKMSKEYADKVVELHGIKIDDNSIQTPN